MLVEREVKLHEPAEGTRRVQKDWFNDLPPKEIENLCFMLQISERILLQDLTDYFCDSSARGDEGHFVHFALYCLGTIIKTKILKVFERGKYVFLLWGVML